MHLTLQLGADWEHVTVRVTAAGDLQGVWYNSHRNRDGCWAPSEAVPRTACGRPIVYCALHGHGVYPSVTTHPLFALLQGSLRLPRLSIALVPRWIFKCGAYVLLEAM